MPVESTKKDSEYDEEEDDVDDNGIGDDDDDDDNDVDYNVHDDYACYNDNVDANDEDDVGGNVGRNVEVEVDNAEEHGNQSVSTNTEFYISSMHQNSYLSLCFLVSKYQVERNLFLNLKQYLVD